jgi:predicted dithiol-disulfide oxidoreductase (DUF899 family)
MTQHTIGTREEWLAARNALAQREDEHNQRSEELARERQELPWVPVEKEYSLETAEGEKTLAELFDGRSQLLAYNIMFGPSYSVGACPGCSNLADHLDGGLVHLNHRDVTLICTSRAPFERIHAYRERMGWQFPWASTYESEFAFDFNLALTEEQVAESEGSDLRSGMAENPGWIAFALEDGVVYHTYSRFAPDRDFVVPYYMQLLDRTPKGRVDDFRVFRHDEYETAGLERLS